MSVDTTNGYRLLTKAEVLRDYRYPAHLLDADLRSGALPNFTASGKPVTPSDMYGIRYYIPQYAVEARIRAMAEGEG